MNGVANAAHPITNALTIDVEDYFQVSAFAPYIARTDWDRCECRVERNVERILAMLDEHGTKATFFTLGWIAERHPAMVRRIVAAGHELASHGYDHVRADRLDPPAFRADVGRTRRLLEDIGGCAVRGYRAPTSLMSVFTSIQDEHFVPVIIADKREVYPALKTFFNIRKEIAA